MKAVSVRLDEEQAERLETLKGRLHNSEAGVLRFALDQLFQTLAEADRREGKTGEAEQAAMPA